MHRDDEQDGAVDATTDAWLGLEILSRLARKKGWTVAAPYVAADWTIITPQTAAYNTILRRLKLKSLCQLNFYNLITASISDYILSKYSCGLAKLVEYQPLNAEVVGLNQSQHRNFHDCIGSGIHSRHIFKFGYN